METDKAAPDRQQEGLTWSLCIPTLNRTDVLERMLSLALGQTRPPLQVIVVDASDSWQANRDRIAPPVEAAGVECLYLPAPKRSSAVQRNTAIARARGDILFLLDDDTFLYPDCAERILAVYEKDREGRIAGVTAPNLPQPPEAGAATGGLERKASGQNANAALLARVQGSAAYRWILRHVLLMGHYQLFVPYDEPPIHWQRDDVMRIAAEIGAADIDIVASMFGYAMTVRRSLAERELFDPHLLAYSPCEDADFSYRVSRHGALVVCRSARLHHFEAATGRLRRKHVSALFLTNCAFFLRQHAVDLPARQRRFMWLLRRRYLAEFLKDLLSRRLSFPNLAGVLLAHPRVKRIFRQPAEGLGPWYERMQTEIFESK